jgi:hypothetical protein
MSLDPGPLHDGHEYQLETSETPVTEDGYKMGEPKRLSCAFCEAAMVITPEKTPGVWSLNHEPWCPNADDH